MQVSFAKSSPSIKWPCIVSFHPLVFSGTMAAPLGFASHGMCSSGMERHQQGSLNISVMSAIRPDPQASSDVQRPLLVDTSQEFVVCYILLELPCTSSVECG